MVTWFSVDRKAAIDFDCLIPVLFNDLFRCITPVFKMLAYSQTADHMFYLILQCHNRFIIQMVVMVVRDEQVVYRRHISCRIDIAALVGFYGTRQGDALPL